MASIAETLRNLSFEQLKAYVRGLSFIPDAEDREEFRAPYIVIKNRGGDCDDIAILVATWARMNGRSWQWMFQGERDAPIQHVLTRLDNGEVIDFFGDYDFENKYVDHWRS
jgi:hypothetical protein